MQKLAALLMLLSSVLMACNAAAQERRDDGVELEEAPAYQGGEAVSIQIAMVEYLSADAADVHAIGSPEQLDAWMKELGAARKLLAVTTTEMSTVDGDQTMSQFGERAAVVTGRTRAAQGPVNSYDFVELGTLIRAQPHIQDNGRILVELQLEKSDISPLTPQLPADEGGEANFVPPSVVRLTMQSTLRLNDGQTHAAYRKATSSPQGMVETVLFITAAAERVPGT